MGNRTTERLTLKGGSDGQNRDMRGEGLESAAGNGLINRRALLGRGVMIAGAMGTGFGGSSAAGAEPLTEEPWSLEFGDRTTPYQVPSKFEAKVVRTLSNPKNELRDSHSRTPHHLLEGATTPNGLHFTINHEVASPPSIRTSIGS